MVDYLPLVRLLDVPTVISLMFTSRLGHMDGCISFWSIEEEDKPLDVRTVDRAGVHKIDFEAFAAAASLPPSYNTTAPTHEPIYKLVWTSKASAPGSATSSKGSYLTVLGGLRPTAPPGIPCLYFPAFVAPANTTVTNEGLDSNPALRDALIASVTPTAYAEVLSNPQLTIEDIVIVPEHNQMLITKSSRSGKRMIQVEQHPPTAFVDTVGSLTAIPLYDVGMDAPAPKLSQAVIDARNGAREPGPSRLPVELMLADVVEARLCVVPKAGLGSLVRDTVERILGSGGTNQAVKDAERQRFSWLKVGEALPNVEGQNKMAKVRPLNSFVQP
jgi:hypothetical protein